MTELVLTDDGGDPCYSRCFIDGVRHPTFGKSPTEIKDIFYNIPNFPVREDDYVICAFPKSGESMVFY